MKNPRLLHDHRGTRRSRFQIHVPPARACRLDVTRHTDQRKRKLFVATLEIDPARIHFDAAKAHRLRGGSRPTQGSQRSRGRGRLGQPFGEVPISVEITNEIQARALHRNSSKLNVAAHQPLPAKTTWERLSSQKIFVSETWILAERDRLRLKRWTPPQAEIITANLNRPAESGLEPCGNLSLQAAVANEERNSNVRRPEENEEQEYPFEPPAPAARSRVNRRPRLRSCDALGKSV